MSTMLLMYYIIRSKQNWAVLLSWLLAEQNVVVCCKLSLCFGGGSAPMVLYRKCSHHNREKRISRDAF
jgi:hypothetical protein